MSKICFVIQPFDNGEFDNRYRETYKTAIEAAGFAPYRVDEDPSSSIPIETIENGIRKAAVCFADISIDNPNVWFEVGLAIAFRKEVCLICREDRQKFPFDVQHRKIITYKTKTLGDFSKLSTEIEQRLRAMGEKIEKTPNQDNSVVAPEFGMSEFEINALAIVANWSEFGGSISIFDVSNRMESVGYNKLATNVGIRGLIQKSKIEIINLHEGDYEIQSVRVTSDGWSFIENNISKFVTASASKKTRQQSIAKFDDDIPF